MLLVLALELVLWLGPLTGWLAVGQGAAGWGWSVAGTLVFLVSDLTFRLFLDGMLGDRRCAGGVGIISV